MKSLLPGWTKTQSPDPPSNQGSHYHSNRVVYVKGTNWFRRIRRGVGLCLACNKEIGADARQVRSHARTRGHKQRMESWKCNGGNS